MQPTCWVANTDVVHLQALFLQKKHIFIWLFGWTAICVVYKFSLMGGLTLCLGLTWLLLLLGYLISFLIVCVLSLFISSLFHCYSFR